MATTLNKSEQEALLTVALMAAFADGGKSEVERAEVKRIAGSLPEGEVGTSRLYQRVLLRQVSLAGAAAPLTTREARQLAYEMAVCVCEADDELNEAERRFLSEARRELGIDGPTAANFQDQVDVLAVASHPAPPGVVAGGSPAGPATPDTADIDRMILNYAIMGGALELLPESLATMAIVPLQMKLVYAIGKRHGYNLDRRHVTELLAAAGIGLTSQVLEGFARKVLGGLLGTVGGGVGRAIGRQVASSAMSFASTYALGQMAQRYYAGGRQLSAIQLKELFSSLLEQGRSLHSRHAGEIRQRAASLNTAQLLELARGRPSENAAR